MSIQPRSIVEACKVLVTRTLLSALLGTLAATGMGQVDSGGIAAFGNLGLGQSASSACPIRQVAASVGYSAAVRADGSVVCWGSNTYGQCDVPPRLTGVVQLACSPSHCVALRSNGTVACWGSNGSGEATPPAGLTGVVQVAAGPGYSMAVKNDGTLVAWGAPPVTKGSGIAQIYADQYDAVILYADGTVDAVGDNTYAQGGSSTAVNVVQATGCNALTATLEADGSIVAWGEGLLSIPSSVSKAVQISGVVALLANGTVQNWTTPAPTIPSGLSGVVQIAFGQGVGGNGHVVALKSDGSIVCWGDNESGECYVPNSLSTTIQASSSEEHTVFLKSNGTVVCYGANTFGETTVPSGLSGVVQVSAGSNYSSYYYTYSAHTVALKSNGTVVCWGGNVTGESTPPTGLTGVTQISAGGQHTAALKSNGTVVCWGSNVSGQSTVPTGLTGVKQVAAGGYHTVALKSDGTVVCWGDNSSGQCNVPAGLSHIVQVAAGNLHTLALTDKGTIVGWGSNTYSQLLFPTGLANVIQVAAGGEHSAVRLANGSIQAWGGYLSYDPNKATNGQDAVPTGLTNAAYMSTGYLETNAIPVVNLSMSSWLVAAGGSTTASVFLPVAPGASGANVTLTCSDSQVSIPSTLHLDAGVQLGTIPVRVAAGAAKATVLITASYGGQLSSAVFRVAPTVAPATTFSSATVYGSYFTICHVALGQPVTSPTSYTITSDSATAKPFLSTILVPTGADSFDVEVLTQSIAVPETAHLTVSHGSSVLAVNTVNIVPYVKVSVSKVAVPGGSNLTGTLTVPYPVQAYGSITVNLTSSSPDVQVPAKVYISQGATTATFNITTSSVNTPTSATIGCTFNGPAGQTVVTVEPATISSIRVSPTVIVSQNTASIVVTLDGPAGSAGVQVALSQSSALGGIPELVTVPAGKSAASFAFEAKAVTATVVDTVHASTGSVTAETSFTINPAPNHVTAISFNPTSGASGPPASLTLTFSGPSAPSGLTVLLQSSNPVIGLPPSITSAGGSTSMTYVFSPNLVTTATPVTVKAVTGSYSATGTFTVVPATLLGLIITQPNGYNSTTYTVKGGTTVNLTAFASGYPGPNGIPVQLTSSNPAVLTVPSSTVIPNHTPAVQFQATTKAVTSTQTVTVNATQGSIVKTVTITLTPTAPNPAVLEAIQVYDVQGGQTCYGDAYAYGLVPAGFSITLTSSDPSIATVSPSPLVIGTTLGPTGFTVVTKPVTKPTTVTITAKQGSIVVTATMTIGP